MSESQNEDGLAPGEFDVHIEVPIGTSVEEANQLLMEAVSSAIDDHEERGDHVAVAGLTKALLDLARLDDVRRRGGE